MPDDLTPRPTRTLVCLEHGLRYDPSQASGCARCRRERGGGGVRLWVVAVLAGVAALVAVGLSQLGPGGWLEGLVDHLVVGPGAREAEARRPRGVTVTYLEDAGGPHLAVVFVPDRAPPPAGYPVAVLIGGGVMVNRWAEAAQRRGWVLAGPGPIRPGSSDAGDDRELAALLAYLRRDHRIDRDQLFVGGFSAGGCGAYDMALRRRDLFSGAVVENGHAGPWRRRGREMRGRTDLSFFLFTRSDDYNRLPTQGLRDELLAAGFRVHVLERPGGHSPMAPEEVDLALDWLRKAPR